MKLVARDHPSIGGDSLFGHVVWMGCLAFGVLLWSAIPAFFLGRAKRRTAEVLHDKTLAADAEINVADWQSATAAMIGLAGVGLGFLVDRLFGRCPDLGRNRPQRLVGAPNGARRRRGSQTKSHSVERG